VQFFIFTGSISSDNEQELSGSLDIIFYINETELTVGTLDGLNIAAISLVDSADLDIFVPACGVCRCYYRVKYRNKK
jgi:hypothetical protein